MDTDVAVPSEPVAVSRCANCGDPMVWLAMAHCWTHAGRSRFCDETDATNLGYLRQVATLRD